jgi:hypothetical protein
VRDQRRPWGDTLTAATLASDELGATLALIVVGELAAAIGGRHRSGCLGNLRRHIINESAEVIINS